MADDSDRVIPATPRRREAARREGLMPPAAGPAWMATVGTTVMLVPVWATATIDAATTLVRETLGVAGRDPGPSGLASFSAVALPTIAVVLAAAGAGLAVRFLLDGVSWQPGRIVPAYRRIDPVAGLARVFSLRTLGSACGSALGLAVIAAATVGALRPLLAGVDDPPAAFAVAWRGVVGVLVAAAVVAVAGWLTARRRFERRIRMTPDEFADEARDVRADPKIRLLQRQKGRQPAAGTA